MNSRNSPWGRLVAGARLAPADTRDVSAPSGFATRVAAAAFANPERHPLLAALAGLSWRALAVAALLMLLSVVASYKPLVISLERDTVAALSDPVGEWLDIS